MNHIKKKCSINSELFKEITEYTENLIEKYEGKSIHLSDEEFQTKNFNLYSKIKNHFINKKNVYLTIRVAFEDNSINEQFHYDGHQDSTVIPLIFKNFRSNELNGDLYISKKIRSSNDGWIKNLLKKILKQNRVYRYLTKNYFLEKKFIKVFMEVGEEVTFNGYQVFHGNERIKGKDKVRASLIVHSEPLFENNHIFNFIKYLRHKRYKLKN